MSKAINNLVIVGGGTAGWLTAAVIAAHHHSDDGSGPQIVLIESPDIAPLGVGEGTWPTMKNTLRQIGISESELFRSCQSVFKQGGKFVDWVHGNGDFYYHPFTVPLGYGRIDLAPYVPEIKDFASSANFQHAVCEAGLAPRTLAEAEYQGQCNYAYHLDATAFAALLKRHCTEKLGVEHIIATVDKVSLDPDGAIAAVQLTDQRRIGGDLFIDCSGQSSLLLGQALGVAFVPASDVLFNDTALAMQVPYDSDDSPIACHTIATAQTAGWIWDIGLQNRRGVGHVYASDFISDDEAEANLRRYIGPSGQDLAVRKISYESGHRAHFWHKNCVAVGMAAGFVEPLEATAIMLVEISARYIAENLPQDSAVMPITAKRFNRQMDYRWSRIIDFLKLHYLLTKRPEPYWQAHIQASSIPESLQEDLLIWGYRGPVGNDFNSAFELFPAASYQYVLYGMEFKPDFGQKTYLYRQQPQAERIMQQNAQLTGQLLQSLPPHRAFIEQWLKQTFG